MPNPIAQQWWDLPANKQAKDDIKKEWITLPEYSKGRISGYLEEKCELYDYPVPETDEEYCFYNKLLASMYYRSCHKGKIS